MKFSNQNLILVKTGKFFSKRKFFLKKFLNLNFENLNILRNITETSQRLTGTPIQNKNNFKVKVVLYCYSLKLHYVLISKNLIKYMNCK